MSSMDLGPSTAIFCQINATASARLTTFGVPNKVPSGFYSASPWRDIRLDAGPDSRILTLASGIGPEFRCDVQDPLPFQGSHNLPAGANFTASYETH